MTGSDWLTCADFAGLVGQVFVVREGEGSALALELVEATESTEPGGRGPEGQERRQFSLLFRGPAAPVMPQGSHPLAHARFGELELFLVPLGPDSEGMRYEAAFA